MTSSNSRRDAAQNRERLLEAARDAFIDVGVNVPLEQIAQRAGVSRTTLHRHFLDRDSLLAAVFVGNIEDIERWSAALADRRDGIIMLYHSVLALQLALPALSRAISRQNTDAFVDLARRAAGAFDALMPQARSHGVLHSGITTSVIMVTFPMAAAAALEDELAGRRRKSADLAALLHRGLFTTVPPTSAAADAASLVALRH